MLVCVCVRHARCSHINAHAAVKLLLVLVGVVVVVVVRSVMLGADANITDVTQKRLCRDILGEDVGRVVNGVDLDNPHEVMCDQLLYKQVFELDVLGLL